MIIGCGEWGYRDLEIEDHFRVSQKFGFHYMELGIGGTVAGRLPEQMTDEEVSRIADLRKKYDVETPFCCLEDDFTLPDPAAHEQMVAKTISSIRLASRLGAKLVRLFAGFTHADQMTEEIWQRLLSGMKECDEVCQELGMTIAVETHGAVTFTGKVQHHKHTVTTDRTCLERLVKDLPPTVGFCYDPGNMRAVNPEDTRYGLDIINDRINYCHLKDWRSAKNGWTPGTPGDGDLDYAELLSKMKYDGVYTLEYEETDDLEDGIQRGIDYLKTTGQTIEFR